MKRMKRLYNITLILLLLLFASAGASAQIERYLADSLTHEPLMYIYVQYEEVFAQETILPWVYEKKVIEHKKP